MDHGTTWLTTSLIYLAAAVLAVPLARALGLGSIIGYLVAGIVIGPWGLALVTEAQTILTVAEFGVVLMLFLVGLELEPSRLWAMRRPIFGWGCGASDQQRPADDGSGHGIRRGVAGRAGGVAGPGDVIDRDRAGGAGRAQRATPPPPGRACSA